VAWILSIPMTTVITYGSFDLLHVGHTRLLERLRGLGDHLIVAVSTNEFHRAKGKPLAMAFEERCEIIGALRCVDQVIAEVSWEQKARDILTYAVDIFGMGSDWTGRFDDLSRLCRVVYLPRTELTSSTELRSVVPALSSSPCR